jgi:hypothetical protein
MKAVYALGLCSDMHSTWSGVIPEMERANSGPVQYNGLVCMKEALCPLASPLPYL